MLCMMYGTYDICMSTTYLRISTYIALFDRLCYSMFAAEITFCWWGAPEGQGPEAGNKIRLRQIFRLKKCFPRYAWVRFWLPKDWKDLFGSFLQHRAGWSHGLVSRESCAVRYSKDPKGFGTIKDPRYSKDIPRYKWLYLCLYILFQLDIDDEPWLFGECVPEFLVTLFWSMAQPRM